MQFIQCYLFYNVVLRPSKLLLELKKNLFILSTEVYFIFLYFNSFCVMEEYHC